MANADERSFTSKLGQPRERFLASVVEHSLAIGRRRPADFIRAFGPRDIMRALGEQPALRAKILVATTGVNEKVATRKPAGSAGEDLEIALSEKVTTEDAIVSLFDPDDRVRYLDHGKLWAFLIEGDFWKKPEGDAAVTAKKHVTHILERARAEKLLTDRELVDGIGLNVFVASLPPEDVVKLLDAALTDGRSGRVFKDERVIDLLPVAHLLEHVDIAHVWERIVAPKLGYASVTRPPAELVAEPHSEDVVMSLSSPSLELTVDEGDPIIEEDDPSDVSGNIDLEAMLARVGPSEPPTEKAARATLDDELRSGLTSRPPR